MYTDVLQNTISLTLHTYKHRSSSPSTLYLPLILHNIPNTGCLPSLFSFPFPIPSLSFTPVHGCARAHREHRIAFCTSVQSSTLFVDHSRIDPRNYRTRTRFDRNFHLLNLLDVRRRGGQLDHPYSTHRSPKSPSSGRPARTGTLYTGQQAHLRRQRLFGIHL